MLPETMRAMVLEAQGGSLECRELPVPVPGRHEVLIAVRACGVCRTDLHVVDGDLTEPRLPLVPGHQIVGEVVAVGGDVDTPKVGDRVGVPWLGGSCGGCEFCAAGRENLCDSAVYTGYQRDGGFADYATADARYTFPIPEGYDDVQAAPLLCAGLIGYRAYEAAGGLDAARLGLYGFGAAAHILVQVAYTEGNRSTRSRNPETMRRSASRGRSAPAGPARPARRRRCRWTRRSCLPRQGNSCRRR